MKNNVTYSKHANGTANKKNLSSDKIALIMVNNFVKMP